MTTRRWGTCRWSPTASTRRGRSRFGSSSARWPRRPRLCATALPTTCRSSSAPGASAAQGSACGADEPLRHRRPIPSYYQPVKTTARHRFLGDDPPPWNPPQASEHPFIHAKEMAGPLGRRFFINTRAPSAGPASERSSVFEGPTIRCSTSSRAAAQQMKGGTRRGNRSTSSRISTTCAGSTRSAPASSSTAAPTTRTIRANYLGTYTFESLEAFTGGHAAQLHPAHRRSEHRLQELPGRPLSAGRHPGPQEPHVQPGPALRAADPPVRRATTSVRASASPGRPARAGKTTLRGSAGIFYDWLSTGTYEQTLRVDGFRQRELNIIDPSYPIPPSGPRRRRPTATCSATICQMQRFTRLSAGIDRAVTRACASTRPTPTPAATIPDARSQPQSRRSTASAPIPPSATSSRSWTMRSRVQNTLNVGATINFNTADARAGDDRRRRR